MHITYNKSNLRIPNTQDHGKPLIIEQLMVHGYPLFVCYPYLPLAPVHSPCPTTSYAKHLTVFRFSVGKCH